MVECLAKIRPGLGSWIQLTALWMVTGQLTLQVLDRIKLYQNFPAEVLIPNLSARVNILLATCIDALTMLLLVFVLITFTFKLRGSDVWTVLTYTTISLQLSKMTAEAFIAHVVSEDLTLGFGLRVTTSCHFVVLLCTGYLAFPSAWLHLFFGVLYAFWAYVASCISIAPTLQS